MYTRQELLLARVLCSALNGAVELCKAVEQVAGVHRHACFSDATAIQLQETACIGKNWALAAAC